MASNYIPNQLQNTGLYVQQTPVFDVQAIYETEVTDAAFKELIVRLAQQVNNAILSLNQKESAYYTKDIFQTGQAWFSNTPNATNYAKSQEPDRQAFRRVVDFGQLPNAGVLTQPHGIPITSSFNITTIYGGAFDPVGLLGIPLPYSSPVLADNIEVSINATNVIITAGANRSNFTRSYIVIEYLEN